MNREFWYAEGGSRAEGPGKNNGNRPCKKWWLPSPQVPECGLSTCQRKRLGFQGKFVYQVLKAAKSINAEILLQIPISAAVKDAFPKATPFVKISAEYSLCLHISPNLHELDFLFFFALCSQRRLA